MDMHAVHFVTPDRCRDRAMDRARERYQLQKFEPEYVVTGVVKQSINTRQMYSKMPRIIAESSLGDRPLRHDPQRDPRGFGVGWRRARCGQRDY